MAEPSPPISESENNHQSNNNVSIDANLENFLQKHFKTLIDESQKQCAKEKKIEYNQKRINELIQTARAVFQKRNLDAKTQRELSILFNQIISLRGESDPLLVEMAETAISILVREPLPKNAIQTARRDEKLLTVPGAPLPLFDRFSDFIYSFRGKRKNKDNILIAREIRKQIKREVNINKSQPAILIRGLGCFLFVFACVPSAISAYIQISAPPVINFYQKSSSAFGIDNRSIGLSTNRNIQINIAAREGQSVAAKQSIDVEAKQFTNIIFDSNGRIVIAAGNKPTISTLSNPPTSVPSKNPDGSTASTPATPESSVTVSNSIPVQPGDRYVGVPVSAKGSFWDDFDTVFNFPLLLVVIIGGALGSSISVVIRAQNFVYEKRIEPLSLFLTGLCKPIVGIAFAVFVFAILQSGLFKIGDSSVDSSIGNYKAKSREVYLYLAIAFVAGFSERFAQDILIRTEQTVSRSSGDVEDQDKT
jgi:hypothetical protein